MKIVISGAHGVGKTTLAKELPSQTGLPILPDVAAQAFHRGMPVNEDTTLWSQLWMIGEHYHQENRLKSFIGDKCMWDYYVYGSVLFPTHKRILKDLAHPKVRNYDIVFYIHPEFPIEADGRSTSLEFQKLIHETYLNLLLHNKISHYVLTGTVEARLSAALDIIKSY